MTIMFKDFLIDRIKRLLYLLPLFSSLAGYGQSNLPEIIPPSPNAASLGIYGQVPVSLFSGLPQVSIPIGNITAGDLTVPVTLNYHGGGIRPDHHAGWVGLGWDLNAGGVITRKVNGGTDEVLQTGLGPDTIFGYYYNYARADSSNWADAGTLFAYTNVNAVTPAYPAPDEFMFNFGGYSGSFFYNQKGKWQVRSSDPVNIQVQEQLLDGYNLPKQAKGRQSITIGRIFYQFILTTPDGTKYTFGGTPESIEFTRNAGFDPSAAPDPYNSNIVPTSWYLTGILSRKGQRINLTYARDSGIVAMVSSGISRYQYTEGSSHGDDVTGIVSNSASIVNPCYLTSITAPNQTVNFAHSTSIELPYVYDNYLDPSKDYDDLSRNEQEQEVENDIKWPKLDSISFYSANTGFLKKFAFSYRQNPTLRLMLDSVKEIGWAGYSNPPYQFSYDTTSLPVYNSNKLDHWGFYNGRNFFDSNPRANPSLYVPADIPAYTASRNSDLTLMRAGILTAIRYPTGGTTTITYEPNDFSKVANRYPFVVTDTTGNISCGGLRVKKITTNDSLGNVPVSKEYLYVRNYNAGGTASSGILAGLPQYLDQGSWSLPGGTISYWFWYDVSVQPLSFTDGNHVTYSEVVEKQPDNSYTIYTYSNHGVETYRDTLPVNGVYTASGQWKLDPNTVKALDRGKLLTRSDYTSANTLLRKTKYDYDTSGARLAESVRMVNVTNRIFGDAIDGRATAYLEYTFPRYQIRQTDSVWDQNGNNPMVTVRNTAYNTSYRLKTVDSSLNSMGDMVKSTYLYPMDMLLTADSAIYRKMTDSNVIVQPVIQRKFLNNTQTHYVKTNYYAPYTGVYVPQTVDVQIKDNPVETRLHFYGYDTRGNVLTVSKENDIPVSYIWGYNQVLPVAEVKNAGQADIAYSSFESDSTGNWNNYTGTILTGSVLAAMPPTGNKYYQLTTGKTLTRSGLTTATTYWLTYWVKRASAISVAGTISGYPVKGKTINGWTYFEHKITGQSAISLSDSVLIDEVRLYPAMAEMTTYTYEPVTGMTSVCDRNNVITYYEYDDFNRLKLVRDQDKNILKKICYGYAGQSPGCNLVVFSNKADSNYYYPLCTNDSSGPIVKYMVAAGTYTSYSSQASADSLAHADVISNGQAYANTHGVCNPPPMINITYTNALTRNVNIHLTNLATGVQYSFVMAPSTNTETALGSVPRGSYSLDMGPNGRSNYLSFESYVQTTADTDLMVSPCVITSDILATAY